MKVQEVFVGLIMALIQREEKTTLKQSLYFHVYWVSLYFNMYLRTIVLIEFNIYPSTSQR